MALREGEQYRCPDPECGCEIQVTRGAEPGGGGDEDPRCCCGKSMDKVGEPAAPGESGGDDAVMESIST